MKKNNRSIRCLLHQSRESHRLKNIYKLNRINKRRIRNKNRDRNHPNKARTIIIPPDLDLGNNRTLFLNLLGDIREVLLSDGNFVIDHSKLNNITKEALVLLTAEIELCSTLKRIQLRTRKKLQPKNRHARDLLNRIGYWDHFNLKPIRKLQKHDRHDSFHLHIVSDNVAAGKPIGDLIEFFENLVHFDTETKDKFNDAMMEAAANSIEHAYTSANKSTTIGKWWLTASLNKKENKISFIFYDQGLGVLNTLESSRAGVKFARVIAGWAHEGVSKGGILRRLMTTNLSQYKDSRRGNGLVSFKDFIDEVESGELTIYTDDVSYAAISDKIIDYDESLQGTLITWEITPNQSTNNCMYIKKGTKI